MKSFSYWRILWAVLIFFAMQLLGGIVGGMIVATQNGLLQTIADNPDMSQAELQTMVMRILLTPENMVVMTVTSLVVAAFATVLLFRLIDWIEPDRARATSRGLTWGLCSLVALALIVNVMSEFLDVPDNAAVVLEQVMHYPLGLVCICLFGPIAEEVTFRGVIQGQWMRAVDYNPQRVWVAIMVQALLFGLVHLNPAQSYGATALGVLFGWVYYRTGSLAVPIVMHITNNTVACVQSLLYPDTSLIQFLGGRYASIYLCVVAAVVLYMLLTRFSPDSDTAR